MFTGIIKEEGRVKTIKKRGGGREITISCSLAKRLAVDESISINGVCHTVTAMDDGCFTVQSVDETLRKTNMEELEAGDAVNLEPSLRPEQLLDGHLVQGHVDSTGQITAIKKEGSDHLFTIRYAPEFKDLIVGRGSICVDGISLTVARLEGNTFTVAIIPYTYNHTNFNKRKEGDEVNLEFDIFGKYVARYLENREG